MSTRQCRQCGASKPLEAFEAAADCVGGRRATCKPCRESNRGKRPPHRKMPARPPRAFKRVLTGRRYLITSAQNATPMHAPFLETLKVAAEHLGAQLVVIPYRYHNPTSIWTQKQDDHEWWAPEVEPYLDNTRHALHPRLWLAGDVKTQPTASNPLSGFESLSGAESCIIGHPKMALRSVPVVGGMAPKLLTTTGACTVRNYTDTKLGKVGAFHHFLGALVVELDGGFFHLRQVNADRRTGEFTDLEMHYTRRGTRRAPPAKVLVMGDTHVRVTDRRVDAATFGPGGIVETLAPELLAWHDIYDGQAVNPHEVGNPFLAEALRRAGHNDVRAEIEEVVGFVNERASGRKAVIVASNHHDFLTRWMTKTDWKTDLQNAAFYLETAQHMLAEAKMSPGGPSFPSPLTYWMKKLGTSADVRILGYNESLQVAGIELALHGHHGPNGSRGTLRNLARIATKVVSGHTHTPGIEEGHYQVGTSTPKKLGYTHGPGSWLASHCVIYASGKRALINIVGGGRWRLVDSPATRRPAA